MRFKIKKSHSGQWFFVIESGGNYETLATSEMYQSRGDCDHAIDLIRQQASSATVTEETGAAAR